MSNKSLCFSEAEIEKLKAFFEQLHLDHRQYKDDDFSCKIEENNSVFIFSWKGSELGWHDESWYDIAEFTVTKSYETPVSELKTDDKIICSIAEQALRIFIPEQSFKRGLRFRSNDMVIFADDFLGISERVKIVYHFCNGEW